MALDLPLDRFQRWMQAVVVHPDEVEQAVASPEAAAEVPPDRIGAVVLPSKTLTPSERLSIYQGMYPLRMTDALAVDYPALQHFLGDDEFAALVRAYVQVFPSRSYTLNRLGDHLPDYLRDATGVRRRDFCHELARLELAMSHVFDAPETPPLSAEAIAAVPAEAWERARLRPIKAFRLLAFRYPVNAYFQSMKDDNHDHPRIRLKDTWVAIHRRNYRVYRFELTKSGYDLLRDLVEGTPLGEAVALAVQRGGRRAPRPEELYRWFREWVSGGMFQAVETA
jgi:hypothetical protein